MAALTAALSRQMPPSAHSMRQSPGAISGSPRITSRLSRPRLRMISSSRSRAAACSASLTRTTTCGLATRWRKHSEASAEISASGSRAIRAGTSFLATDTATSTASVSSRACTAARLRSNPWSRPAIRSSATAARCSAVAWASAKPRACAAVSACAILSACSASEMVGLRPRPEAKSLSNRNFAGDAIAVASVDQLFVAAVLRDHDLALGGEVLGEVDELRLRVVDVAQAHWPHGAHVVVEHLGGARRHVAQEELTHRLGRALERDRQLVLVDVAHQRLRRAGIELHQIVEGEHQILDALGALAVLLLERRHEARLGLAIEGIEDLRHLLMSVAPAGLGEARHELGAQRLLDPLDDLLLDRLHPQHAADDVERELARQDGENAGGMLGPELAEHHRDGLRVFVLQIVGEDVLLHVGKLLPHVAAGWSADLLHDAADPLGRQILLQQPLGRVIVAQEGTGRRHARDKLEQEILDRPRLHGAERGHDDGELAQLVVVEQGPDLGAVLLAEREHQYCRPFRPRQLAAGIGALPGGERRHHICDVV